MSGWRKVNPATAPAPEVGQAVCEALGIEPASWRFDRGDEVFEYSSPHAKSRAENAIRTGGGTGLRPIYPPIHSDPVEYAVAVEAARKDGLGHVFVLSQDKGPAFVAWVQRWGANWITLEDRGGDGEGALRLDMMITVAARQQYGDTPCEASTRALLAALQAREA